MTSTQFLVREVIHMKMMNKGILIATLIGALILGVKSYAADANQKSVLDGVVTSVVAENTAVKEGDVLVTVDSIVGAVPAVRADTDGVVRKVLVAKGQKIKAQDIVIVIESK